MPFGQGEDKDMDVLVGLLFWGLVLVLYWLPTAVAAFTKHRNIAGVALVNCFLGWTGIGWVLALVWALWNDKPSVPPAGTPVTYGYGVTWGSGYPSAVSPHEHPAYQQPPQLPQAIPYPDDPALPAIRQKPIP
jgi:hypothetical protein